MTLIRPELAPSRFSVLVEPEGFSPETLERFREEFKEDVKDIRAGRTRPWSEVKKDLGL